MLGYDIVEKHWVKNPEEAEIVKEIFDRYIHGEKTNGIAERLNARAFIIVMHSAFLVRSAVSCNIRSAFSANQPSA